MTEAKKTNTDAVMRKSTQTLVCPVTQRTSYASEDGDQSDYRPCGEDIALTYETTQPLDLEDLIKGTSFGPQDSAATGWKIECMGGHTLLVSDWQDEEAEWGPLDAEALLALLGLLGESWIHR